MVTKKRTTTRFEGHVGCRAIYSAINHSNESYAVTVRKIYAMHVIVDFDDEQYGVGVMVTPRTLSLLCDTINHINYDIQ